jgi:hypothetical protein
VLLTEHYSGDQIKENLLRRKCGINNGEEKCTWGFRAGRAQADRSLKKRDHFEDLGIEGNNIKIDIKGTGWQKHGLDSSC